MEGDIAARLAGPPYHVDFERNLPSLEPNIRSMDRATQHEHYPAQLAGRRKLTGTGRRRPVPYTAAHNQANSPESRVPCPTPERVRAQDQVAADSVKEIVAEFHQPELTANPPRHRRTPQVLANDHFRRVEADDGNPTTAKQGNGVLGIDHGHIGLKVQEHTCQLRLLGLRNCPQPVDGLQRGPTADPAVGAGIEEGLHLGYRLDARLVLKVSEAVAGG